MTLTGSTLVPLMKFDRKRSGTPAVRIARQEFPGLVQVTTLAGSGEGVEALLLPGLAHRQPWTQVLLGEVWTPGPWHQDGDCFKARWRVLARRSGPANERCFQGAAATD